MRVGVAQCPAPSGRIRPRADRLAMTRWNGVTLLATASAIVRDPSPALSDGCNGLRTRSLSPRRVAVSNHPFARANPSPLVQ